MSIFKRIRQLLHKKEKPDTTSASWKIDWVDLKGKKGTYDTQLTDLEEAEWKFNYLFDEERRIIKMHRDDPQG